MAKAEARNEEKRKRERKSDIRDESGRIKEEDRDERQRRKGEEYNN